MSDYKTEQLFTKNITNFFRGIAAVMVVLSHYAEWWIEMIHWIQPEENIKTFCIALTKLGVYGVDLFFLFSGYAMVKSLGQGKMNLRFVWKRVRNVYIPYLIVVGIIEFISGGFLSPFEDFGLFLRDFRLFISGYDYWYMFVLFLFYIGFIVIYFIPFGRIWRVSVFSLFTYLISYLLYQKGMREFWYVSNIAFALGVFAGEYDGQSKKMVEKAGIFIVPIMTVGMWFVVRFGLTGGVNIGGDPEDYAHWFKIGATVIWTLLIFNLAGMIPKVFSLIRIPILRRFLELAAKPVAFLGKNSLFIYLTHTYVFMECANHSMLNEHLHVLAKRLSMDDISGPIFELKLKFCIAAAITVLVSFLCSLLFRLPDLVLRRKGDHEVG